MKDTQISQMIQNIDQHNNIIKKIFIYSASGVVDRALDFGARGHWFDPWLKLTAFTGK
jgi:hypothetical protein